MQYLLDIMSKKPEIWKYPGSVWNNNFQRTIFMAIVIIIEKKRAFVVGTYLLIVNTPYINLQCV